MPEKINTSDLLNDDNLDALIAKLKALESQMKSLEKESEKLAGTTGDLNSAQKENNEEVVKNAKAAAQLDKAYEGLAKAKASTAVEIQKVKLETAETNRLAKISAKLAREQEDSFNGLSAQYSASVTILNKMTKAQRRNTEEGRQLTARTKALRKEMKAAKEETDDFRLSVGNYAEGLENLGGPIAGVIRDLKLFRNGLIAQVKALRASVVGLSGTTKALKIFKLALISTGIGAIVVALGSLVAFLSQTQRGTDLVSRTMAGLRVAFEVIIDRIAIFGEGLFLIISGEYSAGVDKLSESFEDLGAAISSAASEAVELEADLQTLRDIENQMVATVAKANAEIAKQRLIAEDTNKTFDERAAAIRAAIAEEERIIKIQISNAKVRADILESQNAPTDTGTEAQKEYFQAVADVSNLETQRARLLRSLTTRLAALNKERDAAIEKQRKQAEATAKQNKLIADIDAIKDVKVFEEIGTKQGEAIADGIKLGLETGLRDFSLDDALPTNIFEDITQSIKKFVADNQQGLAAVKQGFETFKQGFSDIANLEAQIAQKRADRAQREVSEAQDNLNTQLQLQQQQLANTAQSAQEELQIAKLAQDKALEQRKKAAKLQLAADSIQQASSLVTAAAKIWGQFGNPAIALPLIGLMFGAFAATRVKAAQLAKEEFAEGDFSIIGGGSHASGNDTLVGIQGNKAQFAERGEARIILSRQRTNEYKQVLPHIFKALKSGTFNEQFKKVSDAGQQIPFFIPGPSVDTSTMERYLKAIESQGYNTTYTDSNGRRIEVSKGLKRIYR